MKLFSFFALFFRRFIDVKKENFPWALQWFAVLYCVSSVVVLISNKYSMRQTNWFHFAVCGMNERNRIRHCACIGRLRSMFVLFICILWTRFAFITETLSVSIQFEMKFSECEFEMKSERTREWEKQQS